MAKSLGNMLSGIGDGLGKFRDFSQGGGLLGEIMGKGGGIGGGEVNPGMKMFGMKEAMPMQGNNNLDWFESFRNSLANQMFVRAMGGMGGG